MFPTIHNYDGMDLTTQGYGSLSECISCEVTEELNGAFTLELTYPLNGLHSEHLITGNIIVAKPNHTQSKQPFRISEVKKSFSNNIQVSANHICYDLSGFPVRAAYSYNNLAAVIQGMNDISTNMQLQAWPLSEYFHIFTFSTDMTSSASFSIGSIQTLRAWMGGQEGSIIDVYGGEWVYDNYSCFLTSRRGQDTGYRISYGKNLAEYQKEKDYNEYSHVCAYWKKSDTAVYSDIIPTGLDCAFRCGYIDASSAYDSQPTTAQLNTYANNQAALINFGAQTITVTPAQLGNDSIGLGDGVLVCYENVFSTRVIKTVWDVLSDTYKSLQLGTKKANISDTIKSLSTGPNGSYSDGVTQAQMEDYVANYVTTNFGVNNFRLVYRRILTSSDHVNNITQTGFYRIDSAVPSGLNNTFIWCHLIVLNFNAAVVQILIRPGSLAGKNAFLMREYSGSPARWTSWIYLNAALW